MSDAQIDGGDTGGKATNAIDNLLGNLSEEKSVFWYGIIAFAWGGLNMVLYLLFNNAFWVASYSNGWIGKAQLYIPVGLAWIMVSMFDNWLMREIFYGLVFLSVMGAFVQQWYAFGTYIIANDGAYGRFMFYIGLAIYFALTVLEQIMQIVLVPRIYSWSGASDFFDGKHTLAYIAALGWGIFEVFYI